MSKFSTSVISTSCANITYVTAQVGSQITHRWGLLVASLVLVS